jgi:predicted Holliday junction resolvase-like endonuclease
MSELATMPPVLLVLLGGCLGLLITAVYALIWKARYTRQIRQDAVRRSQATVVGLVHEQLLPYLPEFAFNAKDARFLGSPIDLIVFDGLDSGQLRQIVFVEVKTGNATLTSRERQIREAIKAGRVGWQELHVAPQSRRTAG